MGRSVSTPSGAVATVYLAVSEHNEDEWAWKDFVEDVRNVIKERYKTFEDYDKWVGREDRAILRNGHALVTVSEYCGLAAICLMPRDSSDYPYDNCRWSLAVSWASKVAHSFERYLASRFTATVLRKLGTFSNGESIFQFAID